MSIYDFNHQEHHVNTNHHTGLVAANGTQVRRQVQDNEHYQLVSRSFPSTHQLDNMSAQLTTLSKTAMLVRQRRAMLEQLSCYLCKGYLIDATTIDECMDSFCKSCIVIYLRNHNNCPKCGTLIHKTNPLSAIRSDKVLQDIVYKLVPGLYDDEMKRRRDFYRGMYAISSDDDDEDGSSSSYTGRGSNLSGEQHGIVSHPKPFYKPSDSIDISIEPQSRGDNPTIYYDNKRQSIVTCFTGNLQLQQSSFGHMFSTVDSQQFKTYLRCPAKFTAQSLKKFIRAKFNICKNDTIHLLYLNETLKDEYSLIDIAYIYDWRGIEHMRLLYIIERDLSRTNNSQEPHLEVRLQETEQRQSVGTSTQTVKRVCIDPHPKFYEEVNNGNASVSASGRNMRSRTDQQLKSNKISSNQVAHQQSPILRSNQNPVSGHSSRSTATNGLTNRNLVAASSSSGFSSNFQSKDIASSTTNESSGLRGQDSSRILRQPSTETPSCSNPKININHSYTHQSQQANERNVNTYSKAKVDKNCSQKESEKQVNNNMRQLVPFSRKDTTAAMTTVARPTQSSLVTLASFTESRSNHVVSMSHTSASVATLSNSYNNTSPKFETVLRTNPPKIPQLAFRFITKQGQTEVQRLNSRETELTEPSSSGGNSERGNQRSVNSSLPSLPASSSNKTNSYNGLARYTNPCQFSSSTNNRPSASTAAASSETNLGNFGHSSGHNGNTISARHHVKVKPVYKTFVDPTKIKSPNFKKLSYTARH